MPHRFGKAVVWIYFKENAFAQPVASASIAAIVERAEAEQSSHLFTWRTKCNRRDVPDANVYFTLCVSRHRPLEAPGII